MDMQEHTICCVWIHFIPSYARGEKKNIWAELESNPVPLATQVTALTTRPWLLKLDWLQGTLLHNTLRRWALEVGKFACSLFKKKSQMILTFTIYSPSYGPLVKHEFLKHYLV